MSGSLVIGATGLVGGYLMRVLRAGGEPVVGTFLGQPFKDGLSLNICQFEQTLALFRKIHPLCSYVTAALPNVDYCESHPEESYAVNVNGMVNVVRAAAEVGSKIVFYSSDYIFDGLHAPYREEDPVHPLNEYGRQKVFAEHQLIINSPGSLIVRTNGVYGIEQRGKNFVYRVLRTLEKGERMDVPLDQVGDPTYALDLARATVALVSLGQSGVFNLVGEQLVTRYQLAVGIAERFGLDSRLVRPVETSQLGQSARRPLNSGLVSEKAKAILGWNLRGYEEGLLELQREMAV